jgi:hypothetical protein
MSHNTLEVEGRTFGRLTVLRRSQRRSDSRGHALWDCRCVCGNEKMVRAKTLVSGETQSCGCLQRERMREYNARRKVEVKTMTTFVLVLFAYFGRVITVVPGYESRAACEAAGEQYLGPQEKAWARGEFIFKCIDGPRRIGS